MRKIAAFILTGVIVMSSVSVYASSAFSDLKESNWAYDAVRAMSEKVIIKGYPDGSFKPNNTVTYGEFIKMAQIAATGKDAGNASSGHWAMNYYNKALELKYFTDHDITKEKLNSKITRSDMALIISSILGDVKIDKYDEIQKGITDINYKTKHEYDITKAYATGILTGYPDNTFRPEKTLTRAEAATVIYRLVDESKRELPGGEKDKSFKIVNTADYVDASTVKNVRKLNPNDKYSTYGDFTEKAELYNNASGFDMKIFRKFDGEDCSFDHTLNGFIYLVKDGKIIDYASTLPRYDADGNFLNCYRSIAHIDVATVDYILVTRPEGSGDLVKIIPNPFK